MKPTNEPYLIYRSKGYYEYRPKPGIFPCWRMWLAAIGLGIFFGLLTLVMVQCAAYLLARTLT